MWLWGLALVAALNPLLVGLAAPRRERRSDRATTAAVGGAIGAVVVLVAAIVSGPILDALDVSRPALRLAVGIVGAVAGLIRLARRAPQPAAPAGWFGGALVPVAVPLVASSTLIVLGLSAGADLGVLFVAGCLAIGVGVVTAAAAAMPDEGPGHVAASWARRLVTVIGIVACVLLVIDAVFAV
jgi:small neutral amino acid transporter SnatA (MarC family)